EGTHRRKSMTRRRVCSVLATVALATALGQPHGTAGAPAEPPNGTVGLAAKYPNDAGIGKDPRVVFADNFDAWETESAKAPAGTWDGVRHGDKAGQRQTLVVAGKVAVGGRE